MADEKYTRNDGTEIPDMVAEEDAKIISCRMKDVDEGKTALISAEEFHARLRNLRVHG